MDGSRFDSWSRTLAAPLPRRGLLGLATLAFALPATAVEAKKKNKPKPKPRPKKCNACTVRKGRRCAVDFSKNDGPCTGGGRCLNGTCNPRPRCSPHATPCDANGDCCSGVCASAGGGESSCLEGAEGTACFGDGDCASNFCDGFRCHVAF